MELRCTAGDLAIIIHAHHRTNLGRIVKVIAPHDSKGDLVFHDAGAIWLVECAQPLTWSIPYHRNAYRFAVVLRGLAWHCVGFDGAKSPVTP